LELEDAQDSQKHLAAASVMSNTATYRTTASAKFCQHLGKFVWAVCCDGNRQASSTMTSQWCPELPWSGSRPGLEEFSRRVTALGRSGEIPVEPVIRNLQNPASFQGRFTAHMGNRRSRPDAAALVNCCRRLLLGLTGLRQFTWGAVRAV